MKTKLYVGLDVHKDSIVVATAKALSEDNPEHYGKWGGTNQCVERGLTKLLKKFDLNKEDIKICYEAGPTGFVLARRLIQLGYDCIVVAPSETPQKEKDKKVRTDRRDARKLARYLRSGDLTAVHIPDPKNEAVRDLARARTDASEARSRAKQQLSMFLLRNGIRFGGAPWTQSYMNHLRRWKFNDPSQQITLEEYIMAVDSAEERVNRLENHMKEQLDQWEAKPYVEALMAFRGFDVVAAMTEVAELGDLTRFDHPRKLMGYLGIVPSEDSTGQKRRQGSITKSGNSHARWMLIECASHYRLFPKVSPRLSQRQEGQSEAVKEISWRAQNRLHKRYHRLKARGLHRNKVVVAIARELCAFIWELHLQVTKELEEKKAA